MHIVLLGAPGAGSSTGLRSLRRVWTWFTSQPVTFFVLPLKPQSELGVTKIYGCWSLVPDQLAIDLVKSFPLRRRMQRLVLFLILPT